MIPLTAREAAAVAVQAEQALQAEHAEATAPALALIDTETREASSAGLYTVTIHPHTLVELTPPQRLALRRTLTGRGFAVADAGAGCLQIGWQPSRPQTHVISPDASRPLPPGTLLLHESPQETP